MDQDEQAIRAVIATWMDATASGDVSRVLALMADDVVYLGPGRPPMRGKAEFAAAMRSMDARVEPQAEIQEIRVFGDWAYCWNQLTITIRPAAGGPSHQLSGPTLSIFRRHPGGSWVIARDANMITPVPAPQSQSGSQPSERA
jgi:uncharacterized protein (TIGR02246 family)